MHAAFSNKDRSNFKFRLKCDGNVCIGNASLLHDIDGGESGRCVNRIQECVYGNLCARDREKTKRVESDGI